MNIIKKTFAIIKRRPILLLLWGLVFLVTGAIAQLNPLFSLLFNFGMNGDSNIFETIVTSIKLASGFLFGSGYLSLTLLALTGGLVFVSLLLGVVFSGGFKVINDEMKRHEQGSFSEGVKNYFFKVSIINFTVFLSVTIYSFFMTVVSIPALVITSSWLKNKPEVNVTALFVDFITLLVLFLGFMFFRTFFLFWYPALLNVPEKAFAAGKRSADRHFWPLVGGFTLFDITFLAAELLFLILGSLIMHYASGAVILTTLIFVIRWAFETFFFLIFTVFIFEKYHETIKV